MNIDEARTTLYSTLEHLWDRVYMTDLEPVEVAEFQRGIDRAVDLLIETVRQEGNLSSNWTQGHLTAMSEDE